MTAVEYKTCKWNRRNRAGENDAYEHRSAQLIDTKIIKMQMFTLQCGRVFQELDYYDTTSNKSHKRQNALDYTLTHPCRLVKRRETTMTNDST